MVAVSAPIERRAEPTVMIVYANFAVGEALARRLDAVPGVALVHVDDIDVAGRPEDADVVVLCPYLSRTHRRLLHRRLTGATRPPALLAVRDIVGGMAVRLLGQRPPWAAESISVVKAALASPPAAHA